METAQKDRSDYYCLSTARFIFCLIVLLLVRQILSDGASKSTYCGDSMRQGC
ncbi:hypothetical protein FA15DRAFT_269242 [Coprinopsis marcescibilis]|uniref:Uncharacterized protein n=1 Tax=Coprinopsis marcescibilis TaxID=230819 RepID=A0A5C3KEQ4_COPMA|nr:hypothetical protein FA15DRAFT_269242 [Coprinopsis marcescibilis]